MSVVCVCVCKACVCALVFINSLGQVWFTVTEKPNIEITRSPCASPEDMCSTL